MNIEQILKEALKGKLTDRDLAWAIIEAVDIREKSFDIQGYEEAVKEQQDRYSKRYGMLANPYFVLEILEGTSFYEVSLEDACKAGCAVANLPATMAGVVYLLLNFSWTDAINWAKHVIK